MHIKGEANVHWSETEARSKPSTPAAPATTTETATAAAAEGGTAAASGGGIPIKPVTVNYDAHESYFENKFNIIGGTSKYHIAFICIRKYVRSWEEDFWDEGTGQ